MSKVYIHPETKVYCVSQQFSILTGSGDADASVRISNTNANTQYDVEVKKEADFFWN